VLGGAVNRKAPYRYEVDLVSRIAGRPRASRDLVRV
jgi:hypothetical protein